LPPYDTYRVNCQYFIEGKKIILKNLSSDPNSIKQNCFTIPINAFDHCKPISDEIKEENEIFTIPRKSILLLDVFRYNNSVTIDTLTFKKGEIEYVKLNECAPFTLVMSLNLKEVKV